MIGSFEGDMVERHTETQPDPAHPQVGCRTLCGTCGDPIGQVTSLPGVWVHIGTSDGCHRATPAEPAQTLPREALASAEALVDALQAAAVAQGLDPDGDTPTTRPALVHTARTLLCLLLPAGDSR